MNIVSYAPAPRPTQAKRKSASLKAEIASESEECGRRHQDGCDEDRASRQAIVQRAGSDRSDQQAHRERRREHSGAREVEFEIPREIGLVCAEQRQDEAEAQESAVTERNHEFADRRRSVPGRPASEPCGALRRRNLFGFSGGESCGFALRRRNLFGLVWPANPTRICLRRRVTLDVYALSRAPWRWPSAKAYASARPSGRAPSWRWRP